MRSPELALPVPMSRVAVVAPRARLRDVLAAVADSGMLELAGTLPAAGELDPAAVDDPLAGEVELRRVAALTREHGSFAALVGWMPKAAAAALDARLSDLGAELVELRRPGWVDPPTLFEPTPVRRSFLPLVTTYAVTPYADVDPTPFAAIAFVVMFGMMFGDVGHGLMLVALGLLLRRTRWRRAVHFRALWPFLTCAGAAAAVFGLLYGEAFGPTGLVPRLWLDPVEQPVPLLVVALAVGGLLLAVSHLYGIVNRWLEAGPVAALLSQTGVAGLGVLVGGAAALLGWYGAEAAALWAGLAVLAASAVLLAVGFLVAAGGGGAGAGQAIVELVDAVVRVGSNLLSFTRLAAFGMMHAALGLVVLDGARALWGGPAGVVAAALLFVVGTAAAFSLELLVSTVQALRLEFYELFSRVFSGEGHPFSPWSIPLAPDKEEP